MYNNISSYNQEALWTHPSLVTLDIRDNKNLKLPAGDRIKMPLLQYLHIGNNSLNIDIKFDTSMFPNIKLLFLNGNHLMKFPDESFKDTLTMLGIARCDLKTIPSYVSTFSKLEYIDARDNQFNTTIDSSIKDLIATHGIETYFSGNNACKVDESLDCKPLCSRYCWKRDELNNNYCDESCNSKDCDFDGGDCGL